MNYKINDKLVLFVELGVMYYFKIDFKLEIVCLVRFMNFNLICGLCMIY